MRQSVINAALVGYGYAGETFHAPLITSTPGIELAAIVTRDPDKLLGNSPSADVFTKIEQALTNPSIDLIVIATPDPLHALQAHAALDAGKHVVIDKPFALSFEEAKGIANHARQSEREVFVFHNRRWDSDFLTVKSLIKAGRLGEVTQFESHFDRFRPNVADRWREMSGAGILNDLGPHLIDQALVQFGMPDAVFADLAVQKAGGRTDDYFHILLRYPRLRVLLHASQMILASNLRFAVHGTDGSFIKNGMDPQEDQLKAGIAPGTVGYGNDPHPGILTSLNGKIAVAETIQSKLGDYRTFYASVVATLTTGAPSPVPVQEALYVMELIAAARRSAAEHCEIVLEHHV